MAGGIPALALVDPFLVACLRLAQAQINTAHDSDPPKVSRQQGRQRSRPAGAGLRNVADSNKAPPLTRTNGLFAPGRRGGVPAIRLAMPDAKREPVIARRASLSSISCATSQQTLTNRGMRGLRVDSARDARDCKSVLMSSTRAPVAM